MRLKDEIESREDLLKQAVAWREVPRCASRYPKSADDRPINLRFGQHKAWRAGSNGLTHSFKISIRSQMDISIEL